MPAQDREYYFANSFDSTSQSLLASGLVLTLGVRPYDDEVRADWRGHQQMSKSTAHLGDLLGSGVPGLLIVAAQYRWDQPQGFNHLRTLIGAGVYTSVAKVVFNRQRPGGSSNRLSFPSGHTSSAFATATSLHLSYGWKVGLPAFLLAAGVGASRLSDDVHWASDVVAGATLGIWMGYAYSSNSGDLSKSSQLSEKKIPDIQKTRSFLILPSIQNEAYLVNVLSHF